VKDYKQTTKNGFEQKTWIIRMNLSFLKIVRV
jgi:hypothetical protein